MRVLVSNSGPNQPVEAETAVQRSAHMALLLFFSMLGVAGVCLAVLYLVAP
ncbi:MAG: hypothetical protein WCB12_15990 [Bryobacteraceae bacterium]